MHYYGKQQCLDKDWNSVKEIAAEDLAYCIHEYDMDINDVPAKRFDLVSRELAKIQQQTQQEQERKSIETLLETHEYIDDGTTFGKVRNIELDYVLDPDLFHTLVEAEFALNELSLCWRQEMARTEEYNHTYKDNNHSRDVKRLQEAMNKARQKYVSLGGIGADFDTLEASLPKPNKGTLKQDINDKRAGIENMFISIGVSSTRAKKIATAITTKAYEAL